MKEHSCRTYFAIYGDFDSGLIIKMLNLNQINCEEKINGLGEKSLKIGINDVYDNNVNNMIRVTLKDLYYKVDVLIDLKEKYDLEYYLEVVPSIIRNSEKVKQILSLEEDVIEFLYKTKTIHDLDYYIY